MKNKQNIILYLAILLAFIAIVGVYSYAYFAARTSGTDTESHINKTAANLEITYSDGSGTIAGTNLAPGWTASKTINIANTGNATAKYQLSVSNLTNTFMAGSIQFSYTSTNGGATSALTNIPTANGVFGTAVTIPVGVTQVYTINMQYTNTGTDQTSDLGKAFSFTIGATSVK